MINSPLQTRNELKLALEFMLESVTPRLTPSYTRADLGVQQAIYSKLVVGLEGFARPLWGIAPLISGGWEFKDIDLYHKGIAIGTNPNHPDYWGDVADYDQRIVEMAAIGFALALSPNQIWYPLDSKTKLNFSNWLYQVNHCRVYDNNWLFFKVLVNIGLAKVNAKYDQNQVIMALDRIEQFYLNDGWYSDGPTSQLDYYTSIMHFYALIYAKLWQFEDSIRINRFKDRAADFARNFIYWFSSNGSSIPYGRSLIYRFAQSAFWGALAFADLDIFQWGVIKGILLRNLRWWFKQPIYTDNGILSVGYTYANSTIGENYNSSASPYWCMKSFLPLALPESHSFWKEDELPLPELKEVAIQTQPGFLICRDEENKHVYALTNGQNIKFKPKHYPEKYYKFAYSTYFGFSVPSAQIGYDCGAHDNMLALSEDGIYFRVRISTVDSKIKDNVLYSKWYPWKDVEVETWIVPVGKWHVRAHCIKTKRKLLGIEAGFALPNLDDGKSTVFKEGKGRSVAMADAGVSGILDLLSTRTGKIVNPDPNTNILYPKTVLPTLIDEYNYGEHWSFCAVIGLPSKDGFESIWNNPPQVVNDKCSISIVSLNSNNCILKINKLLKNNKLAQLKYWLNFN